MSEFFFIPLNSKCLKSDKVSCTKTIPLHHHGPFTIIALKTLGQRSLRVSFSLLDWKLHVCQVSYTVMVFSEHQQKCAITESVHNNYRTRNTISYFHSSWIVDIKEIYWINHHIYDTVSKTITLKSFPHFCNLFAQLLWLQIHKE